jgi:hemerythrin superfamily protein
MAARKKRAGKAKRRSMALKKSSAAKRSAPMKKKRALRPRDDAPSAISLLTSDHREVDDMFSQFEKATTSARKQAIVQKICDALTVHATIEEDIFYPQAREALKRAGEELLDEAEVEHEGIKWRIGLLEKMSPEDDLYDAEVKVLAEYVRHHVKEEERRLFIRLRLSDFDNAGVGQELAAKKEQMTGKRVTEKPSLIERGIEALVGPSPGTI